MQKHYFAWVSVFFKNGQSKSKVVISKVINTMPHLYVLKLENGHFYIGRTDDIPKEWMKHIMGQASRWTQTMKPVRIESTVINVTPYGELACLNNYYKLYGAEYVHTDELLCYRCGHGGHYSKTCQSSWHKNGFNIDEADGAIAR